MKNAEKKTPTLSRKTVKPEIMDKIVNKEKLDVAAFTSSI
jgi:hypothetical protein